MQKINILFTLLASVACASTSIENPKRIDKIQFDGVAQNDELVQELSPLLSELPLSSDSAEALSSAVAAFYREHDGLRVAASVLEEDASTRVVISPEKLGKVNIKDAQYAQPENLRKWVRLKPSEPINEETLTADLGWINTNPYRTVKAEYQTTEKPGVTDLDLVVKDKKNWKILSGVENTGNAPIGTTRVYTGFNVNDFIFTDHTLTLKATTTDHYKDYQQIKAEYMAPLPWRNTLKIAGSYSGTSPNREPYPQKHRKSFEAVGRYIIPQWFGSNPWVDQITYEVGADFKGSNTNIFFEDEATPVQNKLAFIGQFAAAANAVRKRGDTKLTANLDLVGSPGRMLPHQTEADFNNLREGATPLYLYSKLGLAIEQALDHGWSLFLQGRGQFAFADLIPSEQFSLGGFSTVRGYDERVVNGDNAVCANLEIRTPEFPLAGYWAPKFADKINFLGFVDGGYAWYRSEIPGTPADQGLLSFGPGVRYSVASYFTSRFDVGFPVLKVEKDSGNAHVHFSAALSY